MIFHGPDMGVIAKSMDGQVTTTITKSNAITDVKVDSVSGNIYFSTSNNIFVERLHTLACDFYVEKCRYNVPLNIIEVSDLIASINDAERTEKHKGKI